MIIIEISCHNDLCPTLKRINGIHSFCQLARHLQAVRTGFTLSSSSTRCMHHKHMQRIARDDTSRNIENVSRRTGIRQTLHPNRPGMYQWKGKRLIHQGYIDASLIGRMGHHILITSRPDDWTLGQVKQYTVVFHLTESHQVGKLHISGSLLIPQPHNLLSQMVHLMPIAVGSPVITTFRQELDIILKRIMPCIKEIFAV